MNFLIAFRDWYSGERPDVFMTVFCTGNSDEALAQATELAEKAVRRMDYGWEVKSVEPMENMA